jgi:hypothetical protein
MNKELMMKWKIKWLDMFEVPPPLFGRGGREVRPESLGVRLLRFYLLHVLPLRGDRGGPFFVIFVL